MSLNVVLTADKTSFQNHFSDPMILPKNAQIALTKASMTIPIFIQNILRVPQIAVGNRGDECLRVCIDGINHGITWTELFTAYASYERILQWEPSLDANRFFSGQYEMWTNNYAYFENVPAQVGDGDKPKISWVIAKAITTKYQFYNAVDCSDYDDAPIGLGAETTGDPNITITRVAHGANPAITYNNVGLHCSKKINTKINISYASYKRTELAPSDGDLSAVGDRANFLWTGVGTILTSVAVVGEGCMACGNEIDVELNGGFIACRPNNVALGTNNMAFGISIVGDGNSASDQWQPLGTYSPDLIDVGLEFATDVSTGNHVYRIIDGQIKNNVYTGAVGAGFTSPNFRPTQKVCRYDNDNDSFAILIKRGNIINGTYEYTFTILMGVDGNNISTYTQVYQSKFTLNNSAIKIMPLFMSGENTGGNEFKSIQYIQSGADTIQQGQNIFNRNYSTTNIVSIQPVLDGRNNQEINWWSAIGLHSYHQTTAGEINQTKIKVNYDGTPLNKNITWKSNYKDEDNSNTNISYYWIGKNKLKDFYRLDPISQTWVVNTISALVFLPKTLNIYCLNLTLKNFSGSYNGLVGSDTNTGEDRLLGTIPVKINDSTTPQDLQIFYETYNPYYRPLNNPDNYSLNEFIIEISYKDFLTDQRKTIDDILGVLKVELNIRRGADPNVKKVMGVSGLLPYI
tara:strand:- start:5 stop:2065 length:2061 start_codon:yes stop_codon:yes gene_type:complete